MSDTPSYQKKLFLTHLPLLLHSDLFYKDISADETVLIYSIIFYARSYPSYTRKYIVVLSTTFVSLCTILRDFVMIQL